MYSFGFFEKLQLDFKIFRNFFGRTESAKLLRVIG